jgi:transposase
MGKQAEGNGARRRQRRSFTPEFKAEVIALVRRGERSLPAICRELDLSETAVRRWVGQAAVDAGERDGLMTEEREELRRLRRENKVLREERDILKRAPTTSTRGRNTTSAATRRACSPPCRAARTHSATPSSRRRTRNPRRATPDTLSYLEGVIRSWRLPVHPPGF